MKTQTDQFSELACNHMSKEITAGEEYLSLLDNVHNIMDQAARCRANKPLHEQRALLAVEEKLDEALLDLARLFDHRIGQIDGKRFYGRLLVFSKNSDMMAEVRNRLHHLKRGLILRRPRKTAQELGFVAPDDLFPFPWAVEEV